MCTPARWTGRSRGSSLSWEGSLPVRLGRARSAQSGQRFAPSIRRAASDRLPAGSIPDRFRPPCHGSRSASPASLCFQPSSALLRVRSELSQTKRVGSQFSQRKHQNLIQRCRRATESRSPFGWVRMALDSRWPSAVKGWTSPRVPTTRMTIESGGCGTAPARADDCEPGSATAHAFCTSAQTRSRPADKLQLEMTIAGLTLQDFGHQGVILPCIYPETQIRWQVFRE